MISHNVFCMIFIGTLFTGVLPAHDTKAGCTNASIKGSFGYVVTGTRPATPNGPIESFVGVLIRTYDGEGMFIQVDNIHGALSGWVPDRPGKGTYSMNEDCTGTVKLQIPGVPFEPEERIVLTDDGDLVLSATVVPANVMATNKGQRISTDKTKRHADDSEVAQDTHKLVRNIAQRLSVDTSK